MKRRALLVAVILWLSPALLNAQEKPLERNFSVGASHEYRVHLVLRSELDGVQVVERGNQAFAQPFARSAKGELAWVATERVLSIAPDGIAAIEEKLENFQLGSVSDTGAEPADGKLLKAIEVSLSRWSEPEARVLQYRETRAGQLASLSPQGVPSLDESQPLLLTMWLLRALRPAVSLPARALRFDDRWQEPRTAELKAWEGVQAWESGEWLDAPESAEPAARLLIVQQVLGTVMSPPDQPPEGAAQGRFHAESLATISLADGRLLKAARSAIREITWTLASTGDLAGPAQFRARLSAEVEMEECSGPCPSASRDRDRAALRKRD